MMLPNPLDTEELARAIVATVPLFARALNAHMREMMERLSPGHFGLLAMLSTGSLSQRELGERLQVSPSTMSATVTALVKRGWITQERSDDDKRAATIAITEAGRQMLLDMDKHSVDAVKSLLEPLSMADRAQLFAGLSVLHRVFTGVPTPDMIPEQRPLFMRHPFMPPGMPFPPPPPGMMPMGPPPGMPPDFFLFGKPEVDTIDEDETV